MKVITVLGARPQFIKASTVSREFLRRGGIQEVIVHTGQHFDRNMSEIFFEELDIPSPKYNLGINSLSNVAMVGETIKSLEQVMIYEKPDVVLVYGDTNATLAGALTASYLHIAVAHVEAGLRSGNRTMAEEVNRIMTDHLAFMNFAPDRNSLSNLVREGAGNRSFLTGDVLFDSFSNALGKLGTESSHAGPFALMTLHRSENVDLERNLERILQFVGKFSKYLEVRWILHPRLLDKRESISQLVASFNIKLMEPVGYLELLDLARSSEYVLTDSGGLQREAHFLGKRCIILRRESEWVELLEQGGTSLFGDVKLDGNLDEVFGSFEKPPNESQLSPGAASSKVVDYIQTWPVAPNKADG